MLSEYNRFQDRNYIVNSGIAVFLRVCADMLLVLGVLFPTVREWMPVKEDCLDADIPVRVNHIGRLSKSV